jgi:hypothetical protein
MEEEICLVDSCTTNSILRKSKYFQTLTWRSRNILTIIGRDATIVGSRRATITFPNGTQVTIKDALSYPDSTRTLISFRNIQKSRLHVCIYEDNKEEFLLITMSFGYGHEVLEIILSTPSGLYYTNIKHVPHIAYKMIFQNVDTFKTKHSCLGHPGIGMMRKILGNCIGHDLKDAKFQKSNNFVCTSCAMGKLILRPSLFKIHAEPLKFLEYIQGDICGPIQSLCEPFRYFMVLVDASMRWSHVCLLSSHNHAFTKFMTQVIRLKMNYLEYRIKVFVWTMLLNFHLESLMIIGWLKELKYSTPFRMFIHKMVC